MVYLKILKVNCVSSAYAHQDFLVNVPLSKTLSGQREVNICSGNGLVPSGNKPLPEPVFTPISVDHMVSLGSELKFDCQLRILFSEIMSYL